MKCLGTPSRIVLHVALPVGGAVRSVFFFQILIDSMQGKEVAGEINPRHSMGLPYMPTLAPQTTPM